MDEEKPPMEPAVSLEFARKKASDRKRKNFLPPEKRLEEIEADIARIIDVVIQQQASIRELHSQLKQQGDRLWKILRLIGKVE